MAESTWDTKYEERVTDNDNANMSIIKRVGWNFIVRKEEGKRRKERQKIMTTPTSEGGIFAASHVRSIARAKFNFFVSSSLSSILSFVL